MQDLEIQPMDAKDQLDNLNSYNYCEPVQILIRVGPGQQLYRGGGS